MASIKVTVIFALTISIINQFFSEPVLFLADQYSNNPVIFVAVYAYLFFLAPLTFFSGIFLLIFYVAVNPNSTETPIRAKSFTKNLIMVSQSLTFATCLLGVPLMAHVAFSDSISIPLDHAIIQSIIFFVAFLIYSSFNTILKSSRYQNGNFAVPILIFALYISIGGFLFTDNLSSSQQSTYESTIEMPINLLLYFLIPLTFNIAMALLTLYFGLPSLRSALFIKRSIMVVLGLAFSTLLVEAYTMVYVVFADVAPALIGGPGGVVAIGAAVL